MHPDLIEILYNIVSCFKIRKQVQLARTDHTPLYLQSMCSDARQHFLCLVLLHFSLFSFPWSVHKTQLNSIMPTVQGCCG